MTKTFKTIKEVFLITERIAFMKNKLNKTRHEL